METLKRILLVDDNPLDTELAMEALNASHLANEVLPLHDGTEALDYLYCRGAFKERTGGQPAVILLDLKMPKIDGLQVLREIKGHPDFKRIPVVVMTSSREEQDVIQSYNLGVNAYVVKPLRFDEIINAVTQVGAFWAVINEPPPGSLRRPNTSYPPKSGNHK
jgi:CheY-like chemotaxis protein